MNIQNLQTGQTVKNYIELCKLLDVTPTTGNGRKSLLKNLRRYCDYDQIGHKFTIKEIYNMHIPKPTSHNSIWTDSIGLSILHKLAQHPKEEGKDLTIVYIESYKLALYVGLCNLYFYTERSKHNLNEDKTKLESDFYLTVTQKFASVLDSVKKSLKSRHTVFFETTWKYNTIQGDLDIEASTQVKTYISEAKAKAMDMSNYRSMFALMKSTSMPKYRRDLAKILREEHGMVNVKEYLRFSFTSSIHERITRLYKELNVLDQQLATNQEMLDYMGKKKIKYIESYPFFNQPNYKTGVVYTKEEQKEDSLYAYQELIDNCIRLYDSEYGIEDTQND